MLVLSRKVGERILISESIAITVLSCAGGRVRLGIEAPRSVPIARAELAVRVVASSEVAGVDARRAPLGKQAGALRADPIDVDVE
jgi:carbon storage regulator